MLLKDYGIERVLVQKAKLGPHPEVEYAILLGLKNAKLDSVRFGSFPAAFAVNWKILLKVDPECYFDVAGMLHEAAFASALQFEKELPTQDLIDDATWFSGPYGSRLEKVKFDAAVLAQPFAEWSADAVSMFRYFTQKQARDEGLRQFPTYPEGTAEDQRGKAIKDGLPEGLLDGYTYLKWPLGLKANEDAWFEEYAWIPLLPHRIVEKYEGADEENRNAIEALQGRRRAPAQARKFRASPGDTKAVYGRLGDDKDDVFYPHGRRWEGAVLSPYTEDEPYSFYADTLRFTKRGRPVDKGRSRLVSRDKQFQLKKEDIKKRTSSEVPGADSRQAASFLTERDEERLRNGEEYRTEDFSWPARPPLAEIQGTYRAENVTGWTCSRELVAPETSNTLLLPCEIRTVILGYVFDVNGAFYNSETKRRMRQVKGRRFQALLPNREGVYTPSLDDDASGGQGAKDSEDPFFFHYEGTRSSETLRFRQKVPKVCCGIHKPGGGGAVSGSGSLAGRWRRDGGGGR